VLLKSNGKYLKESETSFFLNCLLNFRINFDTIQLSHLESEFQKNPYLLNSRKKHISAQLQIEEKKVKIWFQNRRAKLKRSQSKSTD